MLAKQLFILLDLFAHICFPIGFKMSETPKSQIKNNIMTRNLQNEALLKLKKFSWGTIWRGICKQASSRLPYSPCTCPSQTGGWTLVQVIHPSLARLFIHLYLSSLSPQQPSCTELLWAPLSMSFMRVRCAVFYVPLCPLQVLLLWFIAGGEEGRSRGLWMEEGL